MKTDLIQENIPHGWKEDRIGTFGLCIRGVSYAPKDLRHAVDNSSIELLRSNNIKDDKLNLSDVQIVSREKVSSDQILKKGDIFICMSNGSKNLVGKNVFIDKDSEYTVGAFCALFHPDSKKIEPSFVKQLFLSSGYLKQIQDSLAGTSINNLKNSHIDDLKFLFPQKAEQQKIAEILGTVDEDIAKTQEVIKATEKLKRGLMQQLFTHGIGHTKFKETKIGQIPETWDVGGFKNLVNSEDKNAIKPGPFGSALKKSFYVEKGFKIYGQEQVISGDATYGDYYVNEEKYKELEGFKVDAGDILISLVGTIGKILIVPENFEKGIINPRLLKITPDKKIADSKFIAHLLKSDFLIQQMNQKSHGGTMNILNKGMLMSVEFGVPSAKEQKEIAEILSAIDEKISVNKKLKAKLTLLKKGLMQDLLSGKVRTDHLPGVGKTIML